MEFALMTDCPCVSIMPSRTILLSKILFHFLLTCIPTFILKSPSSFSMGKYWPIPPSIWTPPSESKTESQQWWNVQGWVPSSNCFILGTAQDWLWTQAGHPVKLLLKPLSQNLSGAHFLTPNKLKNRASHRSDSMVLVRGLFQPHWFCNSVIWTAATSMESLKKELGLHQEVIQGLFSFSDSQLPSPTQQRITVIILNPGHWGNLLYLYTDLDQHDWDSEQLELSWAKGHRQTGRILEPLLPSALHSPWLELCALNSIKKNKNKT